MMRRVFAAIALVVVGGCQDYKFNPVGKCIVQPGSSRIQLSSIATADILFVVDDSGSMLAEQGRLAENFGAFITALADTQKQRKANGLDPLEFHLAITTSSIFEAFEASPAATCGGSPLMCNVGLPVNQWTAAYPYACTASGAPCVDLVTSYWAGSNDPNVMGQGVLKQPYPAGNFMAAPNVANPTNPRVLHFTKDLAWETWNTAQPDARITTLIRQFQENIKVGARGSGMEQHLEAGYLAVQKAIAGTQPNVAQGEWPHPGAKLVVVWVGDEDDCSNPKDPNLSLAFGSGNSSAGNDVCTQDDQKPVADRRKFPVQKYVDYFTGLGRPFSAAFIYSSPTSSCAPDASGNIVCQAGTCLCECPPSCNGQCGPTQSGICQFSTAAPVGPNDPPQCSGKSAGTRLHDMSAGLRDRGIQTLDGSVCAADFAKTLQQIAELVKPPPGLTLPTQPAASQVATLRIESSDGRSRLCNGPGAGLDWQFVDCKSGAPVTDGSTTSCITINHGTGHCEANPGETYIAQYLGVVPTGGCATENDCVAALGGALNEWKCEKPGTAARGTCLCAAP